MENKIFDFISRYMLLTADEKQAIVSLDIFRVVSRGTILLHEGELSHEGYFVLEGCLRTYYILDGEEKTTAFYTEMEGITPTCVITKQASQYFVAAVVDSIITISNPDMEKAMFDKFPRFESLCSIFSQEELSKKQTSFDAYKTSSQKQRYLKLLQERPDLIQRVPQYQLASFLGITPQSLSRMRS